jgi:hypothetical protein
VVQSSPCWIRRERKRFKDEAVFSEGATGMRGLEKKQLVRVDCNSFLCLASRGPVADAQFLQVPEAKSVGEIQFG